MSHAKELLDPNESAHPRDRLLVHLLEMPIRWGDMDALGHVNNTMYIRYMEHLRLDWMRARGQLLSEGEVGFVLIHIDFTFLKQLTYPGDLVLRQYVGAIGRSSVQTYADFRLKDAPEQSCGQGSAKLVWANYEQGRSLPLPDEVRSRLLVPYREAAAD